MSIYTLKNKRIWVCGHRGMVGSALMRRLVDENPAELLTPSRQDVDLTNQANVTTWMEKNRPDAVIIAAAKVGGIHANNTYPAEFLYQNLMIASNTIHASHGVGVEKLVFLGSSCIYPKMAPQPISEGALLTGPLEPSNQWYAIAKIAGIKLCQAYRKQYGDDFISVMPTNLFGPGDNYHLDNSHVIPALLRKAHEAKTTNAHSFEIWGTGTARREFMHADDCADAIVFLMKNVSRHEHTNIGSGKDISVEDLAYMIMDVVGFEGGLTKDESKPDGTKQKLMDNALLASFGWSPAHSLRSGLEHAYGWFLENRTRLRSK